MKPYVYQRKSDGKYVGIVELERSQGEKRKRKPVYGNTEAEAWAKLNEIAFEIQTKQYIEPSKDTLIDFLKKYHQIRAGYDIWNTKAIRPEKAKWEQTTAELFQMYIDVHFEPYFGKSKLKDIKTITLDEFYNNKLFTEREHSVKQGKEIVKKIVPPLSINTVIKLHKFLKAAFNYAVANDKIKKNPADGVELPSQKKYKPNVYDKDKFLKLLKTISGKDEEIPIILGAGCGLRRGEICGLSWSDIDFGTKTIKIKKTRVRFTKNLVKNPKNDTSQRVIIAPDYVIETLQTYFISKNRPELSEKVVTRWLPQSLSGMFSDLLETHNLDHIRLHDLRHYNAVVMLRNNISDKVAAERLGHSNVSTLREVYQHVLKEMDVEAADKINSFIIEEPVKEDVLISNKQQDIEPLLICKEELLPTETDKEPEPKPLTKEERRLLFKVV